SPVLLSEYPPDARGPCDLEPTASSAPRATARHSPASTKVQGPSKNRSHGLCDRKFANAPNVSSTTSTHDPIRAAAWETQRTWKPARRRISAAATAYTATEMALPIRRPVESWPSVVPPQAASPNGPPAASRSWKMARPANPPVVVIAAFLAIALFLIALTSEP